MASIIRPQVRERWLLPQVGAITPQYIEMTLRGALAGAHLPQWELFNPHGGHLAAPPAQRMSSS